MPAPRERRSSQVMAEDGHATHGKSGRKMGKEKNRRPFRSAKTKKPTRFAVSFRLTTSRSLSHSKSHSEQVLKDLIQETAKWDLEPKPASLWWTSTYGSEERQELTIDTETGSHRTHFEENF